MNLICPNCATPQASDLLYPLGKPCSACGSDSMLQSIAPRDYSLIKKEKRKMAKVTTEKVEKEKVKLGSKQQEWLDKAKPKELVVDGQKVFLEPRGFSSGAVGYGFFSKLQLQTTDGSVDRLQVSMSLVVVGSKDWK